MKIIIKNSLLFVFVICLTPVFGQKTRTVSEFNAVSVATNVKVKLIPSDVQKVEFKMISGEEESLITKVKNNKLIIKIETGKFNWGSKAKANVKVYYTNLSSVEANAGASIKAEELIVTDEMEVDVTSGAVADLEVEARRVKAEVSSGGRILLEGSAEDGHFEVSSGASLNAKTMVCDNVRAEASSGGRLLVHADKKLNAEASSGGSIEYKGKAEYTNTDSGWSGQIRRIR